MLPLQNRLKKQKDFESVFRKGKGIQEDSLFLKIARNDLPVSRFAFVVGLKVSKKAVRRNKLRRKLREAVRLRLPRIKTGLDVVFVANPNLLTKQAKEIDEIVNKLLKKAGLI